MTKLIRKIEGPKNLNEKGRFRMFESERIKKEETKPVKKLETVRKEYSLNQPLYSNISRTSDVKVVRLRPDLYDK
ncbi:hypothetical protein LEP1GSC047_2456 [Leptospira inadai serovar Lyme str. 10]|uniref:Uncharacterized protein n=2 Tax=Leptospira inadai TaxID=29506 RepID=V6HEQ6_9LEPT|nr:hypothetical protein LEP1GSC047_2456 [Leptospira inadai serovar Lyme str. 10]